MQILYSHLKYVRDIGWKQSRGFFGSLSSPGADVVNKFKNRLSTLRWNKALNEITWLWKSNHRCLFQHSYATLKLVYDIGSRQHLNC